MGKQVKTPRFYVDMPTFLHATGQLGWDSDNGGAELLYMNCANANFAEIEQSLMFQIGNRTDNTPKTSFPVNFCALLNHNLASDSNPFELLTYKGVSENDGNNEDISTPNTNVLNFNSNPPQYNGTSIWTFAKTNEYWRGFAVVYDEFSEYNHQLGSLVVGKYFDCPNSPDLNLTMSRRFDGIKKQKTIGGKTLANLYYDGPTEWTMNHPNDGVYKYPPFELDYAQDDFFSEIGFDARAKSGLGRKGLRSWKLTFSYISESDMWMENEVSNTLISDGETNPALNDPNPMLSDNSFNFVWNCTLGGTLPFIFQPDNTNNNPDQFSICTFRENTLDVTQVASNVYTLNITIDEVA
jgi:hypothetical protein